MESRTEHFNLGAASNDHLLSVMNLHATARLHGMGAVQGSRSLEMVKLAKGVGATRKTYHSPRLHEFVGTPQRSVMVEGRN